MRIALAYLTSLICHGIVLAPLAHLAATFETRPAYTVNRGSAAMMLKASSADSEGDVDGQELQVVMETPPQIEPPTPEDMPKAFGFWQLQ